ncbi:MAG: hypothetical protein IKY79_01835 [Bacteroidales bacterium]|nr:hypothetical protein [Bacteroidales bacterium]
MMRKKDMLLIGNYSVAEHCTAKERSLGSMQFMCTKSAHIKKCLATGWRNTV